MLVKHVFVLSYRRFPLELAIEKTTSAAKFNHVKSKQQSAQCQFAYIPASTAFPSVLSLFFLQFSNILTSQQIIWLQKQIIGFPLCMVSFAVFLLLPAAKLHQLKYHVPAFLILPFFEIFLCLPKSIAAIQ